MNNLRLVLFFSRGVSLQQWDQSGILEREMALYRRFQESGLQISFVTYGDSRDLDYTQRLPGITILCNRWHLNPKRYMQRLHLIHGLTLLRAHVIKTNQMRGADLGLRAARLWRKPLIARCGYLYSLDAMRREGADSSEYREALALEDQVFPAAQRIILAMPDMAATVTARFPQTASRIHVIPNYVDTAQFTPGSLPPETDLVYVGRLSDEKNLPLLLEAVRRLKTPTLRIIGSGSLLENLQRDFGTLDGRVIWQGAVSNEKLPEFLNRARVFVLPSRYEQLPKALLEAMACGLPVLGTSVPGIRDVIRHGESGWLCEPAVESLSEALQTLLADDGLRQRLGTAARQAILARFSLDSVVQQEMDVLIKAAQK